VIDDISKPIPGGSAWKNAPVGTMLKFSSKPPGIGAGSAVDHASAELGPSRPRPPMVAALRESIWRRLTPGIL
jgi:hypothetical protein